MDGRDVRRGSAVTDRINQARIAAIWMVHGAALAKLLRANARARHARNLEAALEEAAAIIAEEVGKADLSAAMDWVTEQTWGHGGIAAPGGSRH